MKAYLLDEDQLAKLRALSEQLHNGTGRERDYGHRLWLVLGEIEKQPFEEEARGGLTSLFRSGIMLTVVPRFAVGLSNRSDRRSTWTTQSSFSQPPSTASRS